MSTGALHFLASKSTNFIILSIVIIESTVLFHFVIITYLNIVGLKNTGLEWS